MIEHPYHERIVQMMLAWAKAQAKIRAAALVGTHARGTARPDSDIDFVMLTAVPEFYRTDALWPYAIDRSAVGARSMTWSDENYGALWSRRLWLERNRGEVEIGFALPSWADVDPVDPGTRRAVAGGCRILLDPDGLLARLCAAVSNRSD